VAATSAGDVEHLYTLICAHAQAGPGIPTSLMGLMDMVAVADLPSGPSILPVTCVVVSGWRRNRGAGCLLRQRITFELADGQDNPREVVSPIFDLDMTHLHLTSTFMQISGLPLRGYGQYFFVVQREVSPDTWEDALPSAGLWVARPDWKEKLDPENPLYVAPHP